MEQTLTGTSGATLALKNNTAALGVMRTEFVAAGGDIVGMDGGGLIRLEIGDNVTVQIADDGGTGAGNYYGRNLNLVRIGH